GGTIGGGNREEAAEVERQGGRQRGRADLLQEGAAVGRVHLHEGPLRQDTQDACARLTWMSEPVKGRMGDSSAARGGSSRGAMVSATSSRGRPRRRETGEWIVPLQRWACAVPV